MKRRVVQICLFSVAAIAVFGGSLQMYLGEPQVSPLLDNVHRVMAGVYLSQVGVPGPARGVARVPSPRAALAGRHHGSAPDYQSQCITGGRSLTHPVLT